jgi:hypothetical protein
MTQKELKDFQDFCREIQRLEQHAMQMKLYVTARALGAATRAAGWEKAGNTTEAIKRAIDRIDPNGNP